MENIIIKITMPIDRYSVLKNNREQSIRQNRMSKIAKSQATITWQQQFAINILEKRGIHYIREKRILHHKSFYLIDIYLPDYDMCIEIDGSSHDLPENIEKDKIRDEFLKKNGYWVFRIRNEDIKGFWGKLRNAIEYRQYLITKYGI